MKPGPLLFFTGGTALKTVAEELALRREPSVHVVTPFDSGGSSAEIRRAFAMPAVGDIRSRILALSPDSALLTHRLVKDTEDAVLEFLALAAGYHPLLRHESPARRQAVQPLLRGLRDVMPRDFDFRGASVGNLVLTALYLRNGRDLTHAAARFAALTGAFGSVCPVTEAVAHLAVRLADGREILGQHRFASKAEPLGLGSPIDRLRLCDTDGASLHAELTVTARGHIQSAGLICYPVGSFFSSVLSNLVPCGVAAAVAATQCPKVYLPNPGFDPELEGVDLAAQLARLQNALPEKGLTHLLVDAHRPLPDVPAGLCVVRAPLLRADGKLDPPAAVDALCRLREATP